jgi:hypothetical protein
MPEKVILVDHRRCLTSASQVALIEKSLALNFSINSSTGAGRVFDGLAAMLKPAESSPRSVFVIFHNYQIF